MTIEALPGQISPQDVATFLSDAGLPAVASFDGHLPASPDELVVIAMTGGPGMTVDGVLDGVSFQVRSRGEQGGAGTDVWAMAWAIDGLLVPPPASAPSSPCRVGSQFVSEISRVGGPPAFLLRDSARRAHYTGNYIFTVSRVTVT